MRRRQALRLLPLALLAAAAKAAWATDYPSRPIRLVVGQEPGGQSDSTARLVAKKLSELLGQPVIVQNRGGAGGTIGAEAVARSQADGYTLLLGGPGNLALAWVLDANLRYNPLTDFVPIGRVATIPWALAVSARLPVASAQELIAFARSNPGKLTYASAGVASVQNLVVEQLKVSAGIDVMHVPYKGSAPALVDIAAGRVDFIFADLAALDPHVRSGAIRLLAAATSRRVKAMPTIPTLAEQGLQGLEVESWNALMAPAGTPESVVVRLQAALRQALASAELIESLERFGFEPVREKPEDLGQILSAEIGKLTRTAARLGVVQKGN